MLLAVFIGLLFAYRQEQHLPAEQVTRLAVMATVILSILAHGLTAAPGIRCLSRANPHPEPR